MLRRFDMLSAALKTIHTLQIFAVTAAGMAVLLALLPQTGHDQLWLLLAAGRMGPHLNPYGPEVLESNPPLALWLSGVIVWIARLLHLPDTLIFKSATGLLAGASAAASWRIVGRLRTFTQADRWWLGFVWIFVFAVLPARDFGQRDHILILLALPYLLASKAAPGRKERVFLTAAAALGLALKPHQALIAIAVETMVLLRTRRLRLIEPATFLLAAFAYLAAVRLLAPTYLPQIVPLLRDTYWAFGQLTWPQLVGAAVQLHLLILVTLIAYGWTRRPDPLITLLIAAGLAATLAYDLQGTGWYYQQLPALSLFSLALAWLPMEHIRLPTPRWLPAPAAALGALTLALTFHFSGFVRSGRTLEQPQATPDPGLFASLSPGTPVATLTTSVDDSVPPAFRWHLTLAQRYPHLWLLPAILREESGPAPHRRLSPARIAALDALQHRLMVEDLTRWRPALILVERCQDPWVHCQVLEDRHDDLLAWFERDPAFRTIFAHYRLAASSGSYDAYTLAR